MISFLRRSSNSILMRILLAIVMLAVALSLGVSNFFSSNKAKRPVAHVGQKTIAAIDFLQALEQKKHTLKPYFGRLITNQEALGLGIVNRTLSELITRDLITQEAERVGVVASDSQITKTIQHDPNFKDQSGKFSKSRFNDYLAKAHLSEAKYIEELRGQISRAMLAGTIDAQFQHTPKAFAEPTYRYLNQEQDVEVVTIDINKVPSNATPTDTDLNNFYNQHKSAFNVPETRSFNALLFNFQEVAQTVNVTADELKTLYKQTDNTVPEKRSVMFIPFADHSDAVQAKLELETGATFSSVYARYTGDSAENAPKPQELELKQLRNEIGSEIFSLKRIHQVTNPIYLGGHYMLFVLTDIKPAKTLSFEEQKFALLKRYKTDSAREKLYDYTQRAEKMLATGAKVREVIAALKQDGAVGVSLLSWVNITQLGKTVENEDAPAIKNLDPQVLSTAFDTPQFTYSDPQKLNTGDYVIVEVTDIKSAHQRTFEAAKSQVSKYWHFEQKRKKAAESSKILSDAMKSQQNIASLAGKHSGRVDVLNKMTRTNMQKNETFTSILSHVSSANPGEVSIDVSADQIQLARVVRTYPVAMSGFDKSHTTFSRKALLPILSRDMLSSYVSSLEAYFPVERNTDYFAKHFEQEDLNNGPAPQAPDF